MKDKLKKSAKQIHSIDLKTEECQLGYLKSDESHFYAQIFNGTSSYLIYYFCYELLDINLLKTEVSETSRFELACFSQEDGFKPKSGKRNISQYSLRNKSKRAKSSKIM